MKIPYYFMSDVYAMLSTFIERSDEHFFLFDVSQLEFIYLNASAKKLLSRCSPISFDAERQPSPKFMSQDVFFLIIQFIVLLMSLSIHESAHAWAADALGDPTARYLGRVSLNPIVHADPVGTVLFPLIGMFMLGGAMFGWAKPVPVNTSRLRNPGRDHMIVAAAGPVSNPAG